MNAYSLTRRNPSLIRRWISLSVYINTYSTSAYASSCIILTADSRAVNKQIFWRGLPKAPNGGLWMEIVLRTTLTGRRIPLGGSECWTGVRFQPWRPFWPRKDHKWQRKKAPEKRVKLFGALPWRQGSQGATFRPSWLPPNDLVAYLSEPWSTSGDWWSTWPKNPSTPWTFWDARASPLIC